MKFKTTKKAMRESYDKIIVAHNAQHLLRYIDPIAYSTRAEGWACDYYDVDGVLICEGYSPIKPKRTHSNYDIEQSYNDKAREIESNYDLSWGKQKEKVNALLKEFVREVTK